MDGRLKKLQHKCKYMGMHENDVIFARFADRYLEKLSDDQLDAFEALLSENDLDIFKWITGKLPIPTKHDTPVMEMLQTCQEYIANAQE